MIGDRLATLRQGVSVDVGCLIFDAGFLMVDVGDEDVPIRSLGSGV